MTFAAEPIHSLWGPVRAALERESFGRIKSVVSRTGVIDVAALSRLRSGPGGASKGELMTAIDDLYAGLDPAQQERAVRGIVEQLAEGAPGSTADLERDFNRLGWNLVGVSLVPIELLDAGDRTYLPEASIADLMKAARKFLDGDLSGAVTSACAAVDAACSLVYQDKLKEDPNAARSLQEKVKRSVSAVGVLDSLGAELSAIGVGEADGKKIAENLNGAINHSAFVLQKLRAIVSDAHGTRPSIRQLAYFSIRWAESVVAMLASHESAQGSAHG